MNTNGQKRPSVVIRQAQKQWLRKIYGPNVNGKRLSWLTKAEREAAIAAVAQGQQRAAPKRQPVPPAPVLMDMPDDWLTETKPTPEIRTTGDLLDQLCYEEMVDWPDTKVREAVRLEALGRMADTRIEDLHDLLTERYDGHSTMLARIGKLIEVLIEINAWKPADRSERLVEWPSEAV